MSMYSMGRSDGVELTDILDYTSHHEDCFAHDRSAVPFVTSYPTHDRPPVPPVTQSAKDVWQSSIEGLVEKIRSRKGYNDNKDLEHLTMSAARAVIQFNNEQLRLVQDRLKTQ